MDPILKDKRFAHVAKDPRFRKMPVAERKVKIDKRFKQMFENKSFKMKYSVDKRGRPVNLSTNENLKKYYEMSDEDSEDEDSEDEGDVSDDNEASIQNKEVEKTQKVTEKQKSQQERKKESRKTLERAVANDSDESESDSESDNEDEPLTKGRGVDFARGEGNVVSSSSDSSDSEDDDEEEDKKDLSKIDHKWNEGDSNVLEMSEATKRLAICNMDWDRLKAQDIYMVLNSFTPANGFIRSVKIFPSEFGKERMAEEEKQGPRELTEVKLASDAEESDDDDEDAMVDSEGTKYHMEKLREYQMKRLRYYYAVMECDTPATADAIYKECDGMEYLTSSTKLDLRFIPDDTEFDASEATSVCTEAPAGYKPVYFANAALSQSKVELTWDETDRDRVQRTQAQFENQHRKGKGAVEEGEEDDLRAYLASSSEEEASDDDDGDGPIKAGPPRSSVPGSDDSDGSDDETEDKRINKYKQLLLEVDSKDKSKHNTDVSMEITWEPGLRETTENLVKKKKQGGKSSVWEEYLEKKKEKKRKKIEERKQKKLQQKQQQEAGSDESGEENGTAPQDHDDEQAFSDDDLPAGIDMNDPFFTELNDTGAQKKKKKDKKKKKKKTNVDDSDNVETQEKAELSLLMLDNEDDSKKHFNYADLVETDDRQNARKKKKKKKQSTTSAQAQGTEDFQVDVSDPRFSAVYESHLFNIDPSAPEYKKTKGTEAIIDEKLKRSAGDKQAKNRNKKRQNNGANLNTDINSVKKAKVDVPDKPREESLASLVKSVKAKTKHFQSGKKKH